MKRKTYTAFLTAETAVLLVSAASGAGEIFSSVVSFPLAQIGAVLRAMSLAGAAGNALSLLVYLALCLAPFLMIPFISKHRKLDAADAMLAYISAALFFCLYYAVNPASFGLAGLFSHEDHSMVTAVMGSLFWSAVIGYAILRVLRSVSGSGPEKLLRLLRFSLHAAGALFALVVAGIYFPGLLSSFRDASAKEEAMIGLVAVVRFAVDSLSYVFDTLIVFCALNVLDGLETDRYSQKTVLAAEALSRLCVRALKTATIAGAAFNAFLAALSGTLSSVSFTMGIPLFSFAFTVGALLMARYAAEGKRLKDDIDGFI